METVHFRTCWRSDVFPLSHHSGLQTVVQIKKAFLSFRSVHGNINSVLPFHQLHMKPHFSTINWKPFVLLRDIKSKERFWLLLWQRENWLFICSSMQACRCSCIYMGLLTWDRWDSLFWWTASEAGRFWVWILNGFRPRNVDLSRHSSLKWQCMLYVFQALFAIL